MDNEHDRHGSSPQLSILLLALVLLYVCIVALKMRDYSNGKKDVFVHCAGQISRCSLRHDGTESGGDSDWAKAFVAMTAKTIAAKTIPLLSR